LVNLTGFYTVKELYGFGFDDKRVQIAAKVRNTFIIIPPPLLVL